MTETTDLRAELERAAAPEKQQTVLDLIDRLAPKLAETLPEAIGVERFRRVALNELYRTPELYDCSPRSLVGALLYSAQLGLEPGPLGHVYLVPFKKQVTWILGYRGMIELAYRSGQLKRIEAHVVKGSDEFAFRYGTRAYLDHVPADSGDHPDDEWRGVYALAELKSGGKPFVVLDPTDVEKRRKRSAAGKQNKGPWATDAEAMWCKSAVRALQRYLPQTPIFAEAVTRDETPAPEVDELTAELESVPDATPDE